MMCVVFDRNAIRVVRDPGSRSPLLARVCSEIVSRYSGPSLHRGRLPTLSDLSSATWRTPDRLPVKCRAPRNGTLMGHLRIEAAPERPSGFARGTVQSSVAFVASHVSGEYR